MEGLKKSGGRNAYGRKTSRHRGGGAKRLYRIIDFNAARTGFRPRSTQIEYDPNRSAHIALLHYADGEKRYILAPARLKAGDKVQSGEDADIRVGNSLPLARSPRHDRPQHRDAARARRRSSPARRAPASSCWPAR